MGRVETDPRRRREQTRSPEEQEEADIAAAIAASLAGLNLSEEPSSAEAPATTASSTAAPQVHVHLNVAVNVDGGLSPPRLRVPEARPPETSTTPPDDEWVYVVWRIRGHREARGVHCGGRRAWAAILELLPGHQYAGSGAALRRAPNLEAGRALYEQEARRHGAPSPGPVHEH